MDKATKYATNGAILLGIANAAINAIKQLSQIENTPGQKFNWEQFFIAGGKGVVAGAATGFLIGATTDYFNKGEKPINTDAYLLAIVDKLRLDKNDKIFVHLSQIANELIEILNKRFNYELATYPLKIGSTEKGTAIHDKFDIDICLSFRPDSFRSTKEMFNTLLLFLQGIEGKHSIVNVREQKKSIGVFVNIFDEEYKIDIVPIKKTSMSRVNTSGYLFVNNNTIWNDKSSYTKTDIPMLQSINLNSIQKKIVIILKNWKAENELPLSSHLLENLVIEAYRYNRNRLPVGITKKVIMVLKYIADNLEITKIRSIENTNNVLTNISDQSKSLIIDACINAIEDYQYQPNSVVENFSLNKGILI